MSPTNGSPAAPTALPGREVLRNIHVLDLSRFIAGPYCTMLLADMGADVIKVERPGGEDSRQVAPFLRGEAVYTMAFNRNKRAITLNTRAERGRELLRRLVEWADVVVENYRPGTMEQMGLGHAQLQQVKPGIILTSISGFGQWGPLRDRALFDCVAQALSGLMSRNGGPDDPPQLTGTFVGDYLTGVYAALGTMLAIYHHERTGEGQLVDVALLDSLFSCLGTLVLPAVMLGQVPPRAGNRDLYAAPANVFQARDGKLYIHGGTQPLFERLVDVMGRPELGADPRFGSIADRMEHVEETEAIVSAWTEPQAAADVERALSDAGIPCGIVADLPQAAANPQLKAREMLVSIDHPQLGPLVVPGIPIKLSGTPGSVRLAPPTVGEHNREVYCGLLGLSDQELSALEANHVI